VPTKTEVAAEVLDKVTYRKAVSSLVGDTHLTDLPALLASAVLFVGNNSGPQHIAAGLGIPTVGIIGEPSTRAAGDRSALMQRRSAKYEMQPLQPPPWPINARGLACLIDLPPSAIYEVCREMMASSSLPSAVARSPQPR
jgi:ADP-heptose:LPS heptosyltransferase